MSQIEPNTAKLYVWNEKFFSLPRSTGHVALHVMDETRKRYLSWWPDGGDNPNYRPIATMAGYGLKTATKDAYSDKDLMEKYGKSAEKKLVFSGTLDYKAMVDWIDGLHGNGTSVQPADFQASRWQITMENCASVASYALRVGVEGAVLTVPWPDHKNWLPSAVWTYALAIKDALPQGGTNVKREPSIARL